MNIHNLTNVEKKQQRKLHIHTDFPHVFSISLGQFRCNRSCRMCPMFTHPPEKESYITDEIFERACQELGDRALPLEISAFGEPFLHPHADQYMFSARKLCPNAKLFYATNGVLLDEERCKKIVDSGIDILQFSLNAPNAETYKWLCGHDDYERLCKNLETLAKIRDDAGAKHLRILTHIIGLKQFENKGDAFIKRWENIVDQAVVRNYGNWAGLCDNELEPLDEQIVPDERYPCAWLWYATKIEHDGNVSKCHIHITGDDDPLGNIMETPFVDIWRGEKLKKLRELHCTNRYSQVSYCSNCMVWSLFPHFWAHRKKFGIFKKQEWK